MSFRVLSNDELRKVMLALRTRKFSVLKLKVKSNDQKEGGFVLSKV